MRLVTRTSNSLGGSLIKKTFGRDGKGIFVVQDEASQDYELNSWMFVKLAELAKVKGVCLVRDQLQLKPAVFSATNNPPYNEFGQQVQLSLFNRLDQGGFSFVRVSQQHRAHPDLVALTNSYIYKGVMTHGRNTMTLKLKEAWVKSIKDFAGITDPQFNVNIFTIDVTDGECITDPSTKTRWNNAHADVGVALREKLHDDGVLHLHDMVVLVPYAAQKPMCTDKMMALPPAKHDLLDVFPEVHTVQSFEGREANVVIYDSTLSEVHSMGQLGCQQDPGLMNVAQTRVRRQFIMLCNNNITRGTLSEYWKDTVDKTGRGIRSNHRKPYLIVAVNHYASIGKMIPISGEKAATTYESMF